MEESPNQQRLQFQVWDSHLVPVKGAVVVHDVHSTAIEEISQSSYFVWCD